MKKVKLSIILPVYNTEKYLRKCLYSILTSTFQDFELIVINDGSPDNSEEIILEYTNKYTDKIIYIKKENSGLCDTRNLGIDKASAPYIMFLDSDDYIDSNMLEIMMNKIDGTAFDMVVCDTKLVYEDCDNINIVSSGYDEDLYHKNKIKETMLVQYPVVWNKIYKTNLIKTLKFTPGVWYEDMEYILKLYPSLNSIGVVKQPLCNYLQRKNSLTYTYNDKLYDIINNMARVIEFYKQQGIYEEYKEELEYLYARYAFATFPKRLAKCGNKSKYNEGIKYAFRCVREFFPNYKKNKYLNNMGLKGKYIKHFNEFLSSMNYLLQNGKKYN